FGAVCDQIGEIVGVVPIVTDSDILFRHVFTVDLQRVQKNLSSATVIAHPIKDVARHMYQMTGGGSQAPQSLGALDCPLRMLAGLDGMDPVMIRCRAVRMILQ